VFRVHDDVVERIVELRAEGITTALLTNSFKEFRAHIESHVDFGIFDLVIDSSEVGCRKPEPEIYELTTERLGIAPERILYLDDFLANVEGARGAGWDAIHVTGPEQALAALDLALGSAPD
jgi:putative hydrolase of the HAD superfamily